MGFVRFIYFLRFIFSSFWVWSGTIILVTMVGGVMIAFVKTCKRGRNVTAYRVGERWHIKAENITSRDMQRIMDGELLVEEERDDGKERTEGNAWRAGRDIES